MINYLETLYAETGCNRIGYEHVIGNYAFRNINDNSNRLLELCSLAKLAISNRGSSVGTSIDIHGCQTPGAHRRSSTTFWLMVVV